VIPEQYTFTAPEGFILTPEFTGEVTPLLKDLGLSQEQADKLAGFHIKQLQAATKGPQEAYLATRKDWQSKVLNDPQIKGATSGGKAGIEAVQYDIGRALSTLNDPALVQEFRQAMDITGAGDNPAFVKAFWRLSQRIAEGQYVTPGSPSPAGQTEPGRDHRPSIASALYPNLR